ncbi:sulfotransferase family protein [Crocosphaera chwakensis]|uniref:Sulfotransferase n=1 Tax=Crocosphaera chwakensis CCY0110 TaxID=391612 RepID=A3ILZ8_9CHRO|nr:sulfotransferase [Crocosphaera chwakensis]EAZ92454.1 hypothetical protein CY0110_01974 [Crocosphaera chwakensis CCY0110]
MSLTLSDILNFRKIESPVFIVGAPRSGTSLLYRILQHHSSFKLQHYQKSSKVELTESLIFQYPYKILGSEQLDYMLNNKEKYNEFLNSTEWIRKYQNTVLAQKIVPKILAKSNSSLIKEIVWQLTMTHFLVATFFYYAKQARNVKRIIEKTPQSIFMLPEIKKTFPQAKLLFIYRHPIDVFSSYKKRFKITQQLNNSQSSLGWLKITKEKFCEDYELSINLALQEKNKNSQQFMMVAYESLVEYPQKTITEICDFINESFEEQCLVQNQSDSINWKVDPDLFGTINKRTKNWTEFIDERDGQFIENRLNTIMKLLNYNKYTN